jgi:ribonuclease BN (tRNA processing enzyme)
MEMKPNPLTALIRFFAPIVLSGAMILATHPVVLAQSCAADSAAVQILGSGGPALNPERASASYLLWVGGRARMLVDIGGGAYLRFGQSRAKTSDLALVAISHLHPDHVSDLPALLWLSHTVRTEPLPIVGPSAGKGAAGPAGNDVAPDFQTFLSRLFDEKSGAFQVLGGALGGKGNGVRLNVSTVDVLKTEPTKVFDGEGLKVTALGIPHANMPTIAYRVETPDGSVVFSSDQNGTDPRFVDFARDADTLIMHMQVPAGTTNNPLHAAPAVVGRIARDAHVRRLIVGHLGLAGAMLEAAVADLKTAYTGPLTVGADLQCTPIRG